MPAGASAAAAFVAWLVLVWYATSTTIARTNREELLAVAMWGVAIVVGGLFLLYTWTVAVAIIERGRLRGTLDRATRLADETLTEGRSLADAINRRV